ncbi:hypothetical protein U3516DRAFT_764930 [Neocallimastix sp. 'constans']
MPKHFVFLQPFWHEQVRENAIINPDKCVILINDERSLINKLDEISNILEWHLRKQGVYDTSIITDRISYIAEKIHLMFSLGISGFTFDMVMGEFFCQIYHSKLICEIYNSYSTTETTVIITIKINDDNHINIGNPLSCFPLECVELREIEEILKQINKIDFCFVIDKLNSKDVKFLVGYYTIKSEMNISVYYSQRYQILMNNKIEYKFKFEEYFFERSMNLLRPFNLENIVS